MISGLLYLPFCFLDHHQHHRRRRQFFKCAHKLTTDYSNYGVRRYLPVSRCLTTIPQESTVALRNDIEV